MKKIFFLIPIIIIAIIPSAYAHPFLLESNPPADSTISGQIESVIIYFSEAVDVNFSNIKILDGDGNQIDNKDTAYYEDEMSLIVTSPTLEDGVYTVTTKVLSKVDGHLVDYALVFGVGDVKLDTTLLDKQKNSESVFVPESLSRFPGLVGQTIILGAIISTILIWREIHKKSILESDYSKLLQKFDDKYSTILAIGIALVFISNLAILAVQTWRLETGIIEAIRTTFGATWTIRMEITIALLVMWFAFDRIKIKSFKKHIPNLVLALALIGTTTMMGHGAASEQFPAIVLDYIHNLLSGVWIGGVIFFAFVLLPSFRILSIQTREKIVLVTIPKFSTIIVLSLGILLITGPILLWFLESNVNSLSNSSYGYLLFAKIAIGIVMIIIGGYNQLKIFKKGENDFQNNNNIKIYNKIKKTLKIESLLGVTLLLFVAFLTNTGLPAGEIQLSEAHAQNQQFKSTEFSENARFNITIDPLAPGKNRLSVTPSNLENNPIGDMNGMKVKISNPSKNISPIEIPMTKLDTQNALQTFEGEVTFGFSGTWMIEIELQRLQEINENLAILVFVKPHLEDIRTQVTEYDLPEDATPLFPISDEKGNIWISDPLKPRIWKFNIESEIFQKYEFDGKTSIALEIDNDGNIWFTDIPKSTIGKFDPVSEKFKLYELPAMEPTDQNGIAIALETDKYNNIWVSVTNKNAILKFDQTGEKFTEYILPTENSGPFALTAGPENNIWYSGTISGKIGVIDINTGKIIEFTPNQPLEGAEAMIFDSEGNLWIGEHTGAAITKFNSFLETFEKIDVPNENSLPFGMVLDKYQNLWFAQHVVDSIGVYDLINQEFIEIEIPNKESFTQFVTIYGGNIWFVEQQNNKLGKISISEVPNLEIQSNENVQSSEIKYSHIIAPIFTIGIVVLSLFFVKSVKDKRRLDEKIN